MNSGDNIKIAENAGAGNGADQLFLGGRAVFVAEATWGGGSCKVQYKTRNGTYIDVPGATLSANGMTAAIDLPAGTYRAVIATATGVHAWLLGSRN